MSTTVPMPNPNVAYHVRSYDAHLSFTEWTPGAVSRWIGKCRHCKKAARVDVRQDIQLTWEWFSADKAYCSKRTYQYEALTLGATHHMSHNGNYVLMTCDCLPSMYFTCKRIEGVYSDSVKCNAKCMNATGPSCECQCAGEHHGAGHASA
jgi:hypothetical protein